MKVQNGYLPLILMLLGFGAIYVIYTSPNISNDAILPALGGLCLILGLISLRSSWQKEKRLANLAIMETAMGAVILMIGIVEALHVELPQAVWYALLVIILGLLVFFAFFRFRRKK